MSTNKIFLHGNVGKDPETHRFDNGGQITNLTLATTDRYKDKDGNPIEHTDWHNLVFKNKMSELAEKYIKKGDKLFIEGKLSYRKYTNKDGNDIWITEVVVLKVDFLTPKKQ